VVPPVGELIVTLFEANAPEQPLFETEMLLDPAVLQVMEIELEVDEPLPPPVDQLQPVGEGEQFVPLA
jgi:hypothetical protein